MLIFLAIASCSAYEARPEEGRAARVAVASETGAARLKTGQIESLVHEMVNRERKSHGLTTLQWDEGLTGLARDHSTDMVKRGTLSHTNSRGEDPTTRAKKMGLSVTKVRGSVTWTGIAENVGLLPAGNLKGYGPVRTERDVAAAMLKHWIESSSHRANILNPQAAETVVVLGHAAATDAPSRRFEATNAWRIPAAWRAVVRDGQVSAWQVYADSEPVRRILRRAGSDPQRRST